MTLKRAATLAANCASFVAKEVFEGAKRKCSNSFEGGVQKMRETVFVLEMQCGCRKIGGNGLKLSKMVNSPFVFCLVAVVLFSCVSSSPLEMATKIRTTLNSCHAVEPLLINSKLKVTIPKHPVNGTRDSICSSDNSRTCCTPEIEAELMIEVRKNFRALLYHNSRSVEGVLATTTRMLEDHMVELIKRSENTTLGLFHQVYRTMAVLSTEPIRKLYADIIYQGTQNRERVDVTLPLEVAVLNFFTDLFPLVYHHTVNPHLRDYSNEYKRCLRETILEIKPFGEVPKELGEKIGKTMKAVKVFLDALEIGTDVLNQTDALFDSSTNDRCHTELLRMSFCPKCKGLSAKPCNGYCLNVLRGCLTQFSSQLDLPWSGYVDSLRQLVVGNDDYRKSYSLINDLDDIVKSLDTKISMGIMNAMLNGQRLEEKVKRACGAPQWSDDDEQPVPVDGAYDAEELLLNAKAADVKVTPHLGSRSFSRKLEESQKQLTLQLTHFLSSIEKTKGFYEHMAESLCSDESFAEIRDTADCWNGQTIGEYTKAVVSASVSAQKYNPEVKFSSDFRVNYLSEKLRTIRQAVLGVLSSPAENEMYLRDEEGSGSGYPTDKSRYPDDDEETYGDGEGSGSGYSEIDTYKPRKKEDVVPHDSRPKTRKPVSAATHLRHFTWWSLLISAWVCRRLIQG